jgi:hypothetical protein
MTGLPYFRYHGNFVEAEERFTRCELEDKTEKHSCSPDFIHGGVRRLLYVHPSFLCRRTLQPTSRCDLDGQ